MSRHDIDDDGGQAVPLVIGVVAVLVVVTVGFGWYGRSLVDAAEARTAADAAALAGAIDGPARAGALARANGGELLRFRRIGDDVLVTVQVGRAHASARASLSGVGAYTRFAWPRSTDRLTRSMERQSPV